MGLGGDRTQRHGTGSKPLHDLGGGLDFVQRDGLGRIDLKLKETPQRHMTTALVVDDLGVFFVGRKLVGPHRMLQLGDGIGRPHMVFAAHPPGVLSAGIEHGGKHRIIAKGLAMHAQGLLGHFKNADALDRTGRTREVLIDRDLVNTDGLKDLGAAVRHIGGDAHLRHDLREALADGLHIIGHRLLSTERAREVFVHRDNRLHGQIRMHGFGAVAREHGKVVHLTGRSRFDHEARLGAQSFTHQMLVYSRQSKQGGNGHLGGGHTAVRQNQNIRACANSLNRLCTEGGKLGLDPFLAPVEGVGDRELL